jgi:protein-S-isoprenylcysteine O-methyltransferase Ste14
MTTRLESGTASGPQLAAKGLILLSFIVALEIVIMISPFALFFYAIFNPFLLALAHAPATRWLTAFFLPHMIVPPNAVLAAIRVSGSALFVLGVSAFLICAMQVYVGKLWKTGVATKGLYAVIRHPQYVALAVAGVGLAIMWPRFLTLVLFAVMLFLYYLLARDEERRMLGRYRDSYRAYVDRTGMFLPKFAEGLLPGQRPTDRRLTPGKLVAILFLPLAVAVGSGFALRTYTVNHLPLASVGVVDLIGITAEDVEAAREILPSVLGDPAVAARLRAATGREGHRLLSYVIPIDYTMQGMIADTGEEWRLFEQHKTIGMITEYVVHPFAHLTEGHAHRATPHGSGTSAHDSPAMKRRIIFVDVSSGTRPLLSSRDDFGIDVNRTPRFFVDVHLHTAEVLQVKDIPSGSGWGTVPTPAF